MLLSPLHMSNSLLWNLHYMPGRSLEKSVPEPSCPPAVRAGTAPAPVHTWHRLSARLCSLVLVCPVSRWSRRSHSRLVCRRVACDGRHFGRSISGLDGQQRLTGAGSYCSESFFGLWVFFFYQSLKNAFWIVRYVSYDEHDTLKLSFWLADCLT